jgi:hypothetical protein
VSGQRALYPGDCPGVVGSRPRPWSALQPLTHARSVLGNRLGQNQAWCCSRLSPAFPGPTRMTGRRAPRGACPAALNLAPRGSGGATFGERAVLDLAWRFRSGGSVPATPGSRGLTGSVRRTSSSETLPQSPLLTPEVDTYAPRSNVRWVHRCRAVCPLGRNLGARGGPASKSLGSTPHSRAQPEGTASGLVVASYCAGISVPAYQGLVRGARLGSGPEVIRVVLDIS